MQNLDKRIELIKDLFFGFETFEDGSKSFFQVRLSFHALVKEDGFSTFIGD